MPAHRTAAVVAAVLLVASTTGPAPAGDGLVARGGRIAERACASCHAIGTTGASPRAEAPPFRRLGAKYPPAALEEALAEGIVVGHPDMPKMSARDVEAFVAWLKTIQTP